MERIGFIDFKGNKILSLNFSGYSKTELIDNLAKAEKLVVAHPQQSSLLVLIEVYRVRLDAQVADAFKSFYAKGKPHVKRVAVIGVTGIYKLLYGSFAKHLDISLTLHDHPEAAKEWLIRN